MKRIKTGIILVILFLAGMMQGFARNNADTTSPAVTVLRFACVSTSDDSIQLKSVVSVKHDDGSTNLVNAPVIFYSVEKDGDLKIGEVKTDVHGTAVLKIPARNTFLRNDQQMLSFKAMYDGNDKYEASEGEFGLKPAKLVVSFYEEDSIRYVKVEGTQLNSDGTEVSIGAVDVIISVPKMFSMLKIAEISLDSTGIGTAEFPRDIIGDSTGNLTVVASIEENDIFGTVQGSSDKNWGLHKHLISPDRPSRELWTPIAPLWMIITLIVMLLGVWGHYVYAVVQLVMINKSSKIPPEESNKA
ncbi:MAG: hypothetical protein Q7U54_18950 [Bacteroidales bacterium]|nr:hypothetical protein [Bacteroidales bacterium]